MIYLQALTLSLNDVLHLSAPAEMVQSYKFKFVTIVNTISKTALQLHCTTARTKNTTKSKPHMCLANILFEYKFLV